MKDNAVSSDYNDAIWNNWNDNAIIERKSEYTSITNKTTGTAGSWQIHNQPFSNSNLKIEFDVYVDSETQSSVFAQLRNQGYNVLGNISLTNINLALNTWHHIIFEFNGNYCAISNTTNTSTSNRNFNEPITKFMLRCDINATETRYKNFRVYPI